MAFKDQQETVLIVDDTPANIALLSATLKQHYKIKAALNGEMALQLARQQDAPDLILLDVMMPDMDGYEVCRRLKANPLTAAIPVIFVTAKTETEDEQLGFDLGAVDYISKPVSPPLVKARVHNHLKLYDQARHLEILVQERTREIQSTRLEIIRRLGRAAEFKDNETGMHVIRMSQYSLMLARAAGQPEDWCQLLYQAAPMHDIGKIGIPDRILLKAGKLDADEWEIMKQHALYGAEIIGNHPSALLQLAKEVALTHHERWDGTGYPNGLAADAIPLSGRIVAIADVYDALTSDRPYKTAWPEQQAVGYLQEQAGRHFDPDLIQHFIRCLPQIRQIQQQYAESAHSVS